MDKKITYNLTVRLYAQEKCFGPGIAQLLHRVQQLSSLRAAAIDMNMAYSKAWKVIRQAEAQLGFPLLHSVTGGRGGGGAELTETAAQLLASYDAFCAELDSHADTLFREKFADLVGEQ